MSKVCLGIQRSVRTRIPVRGSSDAVTAAGSLWPLFERFPALSRLPRFDIRTAPTPVQNLYEVSPNLWVKRDDLTAPLMGGNKVRSLEFLLGGTHAGERIATIGSAGSTHVLST